MNDVGEFLFPNFSLILAILVTTAIKIIVNVKTKLFAIEWVLNQLSCFTNYAKAVHLNLGI